MDVVKYIKDILDQPDMMMNPMREVINYDDVLDAMVKTDDGWMLSHKGEPILFVDDLFGSSGLHDAIYELCGRFNGHNIGRLRNVGFDV